MKSSCSYHLKIGQYPYFPKRLNDVNVSVPYPAYLFAIFSDEETIVLDIEPKNDVGKNMSNLLPKKDLFQLNTYSVLYFNPSASAIVFNELNILVSIELENNS